MNLTVSLGSHKQWLQSIVAKQPSVYRHKKWGGYYAVLGFAKDSGTTLDIVVYRNLHTGEVWTRPLDEFEDGRFEYISGKTTEELYGRG